MRALVVAAALSLLLAAAPTYAQAPAPAPGGSGTASKLRKALKEICSGRAGVPKRVLVLSMRMTLSGIGKPTASGVTVAPASAHHTDPVSEGR